VISENLPFSTSMAGTVTNENRDQRTQQSSIAPC